MNTDGLTVRQRTLWEWMCRDLLTLTAMGEIWQRSRLYADVAAPRTATLGRMSVDAADDGVLEDLVALEERGLVEQQLAENPAHGAELCSCGHRRSEHAEPVTVGDSRCLVVAERQELAAVFDDGRGDDVGYCACLGFRSHYARTPSRIDRLRWRVVPAAFPRVDVTIELPAAEPELASLAAGLRHALAGTVRHLSIGSDTGRRVVVVGVLGEPVGSSGPLGVAGDVLARFTAALDVDSGVDATIADGRAQLRRHLAGAHELTLTAVPVTG